MIADEMGLTKAAVYYYFPAKRDILHAVLQPGLQRLAALVDEAATMRGRRARIEHLVNGFVDFLVKNRHYAVMAAIDPAAKRHELTNESMTMRKRTLTLLFGDNPTGTERLGFNSVFFIPESLPELADLSDDELREALQRTMLHMLRVPAGPKDPRGA
jgi:AcrR family transcriptional regulator